MEGNWGLALIMLVVGGFMACAFWNVLIGYPDSTPADAPMGKQIVWGIVLASLVVAASAYAYFGDISGAPADRFAPRGDQFFAP